MGGDEAKCGVHADVCVVDFGFRQCSVRAVFRRQGLA